MSTDVVRYRLGKLGFVSGEYGAIDDEFDSRQEDAAHDTILRWLEHRPPTAILSLGESGSDMSGQLRLAGHQLISVSVEQLGTGLPPEVVQGGPYDVVLAADVLERIREPEQLLAQIRSVLTTDGQLVVAVPNFGHWYVRMRTLFGLFDYDQRGVLDRSHLRFFTRSGIIHRLRMAGFDVVRQEATGLPLDVFTPSGNVLRRLLGAVDRVATMVRPTLFGYQLVCMCERSRTFDAARAD